MAEPAPADAADLLPGYYLDLDTGAWLTLPWPANNNLEALPDSLGPQCIAWAHAYLLDHLTGDPWEFTLSQKRWLHLWYAIRPDGRWLYRRGVVRRAKLATPGNPGCWYCEAARLPWSPPHTAGPTTVSGNLDVPRLVCAAHYRFVYERGRPPTTDESQHWHRVGKWRKQPVAP